MVNWQKCMMGWLLRLHSCEWVVAAIDPIVIDILWQQVYWEDTVDRFNASQLKVFIYQSVDNVSLCGRPAKLKAKESLIAPLIVSFIAALDVSLFGWLQVEDKIIIACCPCTCYIIDSCHVYHCFTGCNWRQRIINSCHFVNILQLCYWITGYWFEDAVPTFHYRLLFHRPYTVLICNIMDNYQKWSRQLFHVKS